MFPRRLSSWEPEFPWDREYYEHRWLIDPLTGEIVFWTSDTGIDGQNRIDLDELDHLVSIEPERFLDEHPDPDLP